MTCGKIMAVLEARDIVKSFGNRVALRTGRVSFGPAEITALCGPNGSGKTTFLKVLALLDFPDRGEIAFRGRALSRPGDWFSARKKITMVFQNPYAFPRSVEDNVAYPALMRGFSSRKAKAKAREAMEQLGLLELARREARALSAGELQRMALARALVCEPEVLLLDEPTAHGDDQAVAGIEAVMKDLRDRKGITIVFATHFKDQAARLADRVLSLEEGEVMEEKKPLPARLARKEGKLLLKLKLQEASPAEKALLCAIELSSHGVILKMRGPAPPALVSKEEVDREKPVPGETVVIIQD